MKFKRKISAGDGESDPDRTCLLVELAWLVSLPILIPAIRVAEWLHVGRRPTRH